MSIAPHITPMQARKETRAKAVYFVLPPREGIDEHRGLAYELTEELSSRGVTQITGLARKALDVLFDSYVKYGPNRDRSGHRISAVQQAVYETRNMLFPRRGPGKCAGAFTAIELAEANAWRRQRENRNQNGMPRDLDWFTLAVAYYYQAIATVEAQ